MVAEVEDRDMGYKRIMKGLRQIALDDPGVLVGIRQQAEAPAGVDISMVELGAVHEFGSLDGKIPERSFIRSGVDVNESKYATGIGDAIGRSIDGTMALKTGLGRVGAVAVGDIQTRITNKDIHQDLAESTKERKGSDTALVDTGHLLKVIDWQLEGV